MKVEEARREEVGPAPSKITTTPVIPAKAGIHALRTDRNFHLLGWAGGPWALRVKLISKAVNRPL